MKNYILNEDEVILLRGMVAQFYDWKEGRSATAYTTELLLTNINIVLGTDDDTPPQTYPIENIKVYDQKPQIIRRKSVVEIYHKSGEIYLKFEQEKSAKDFCDKTLKLRSGNTKFVRSVKSAEKIIKENTDPLGIDAKKLIKSTATVACQAFSTYVSGGKKGLGVAAQALADAMQKPTKEKPSLTASNESEE